MCDGNYLSLLNCRVASFKSAGQIGTPLQRRRIALLGTRTDIRERIQVADHLKCNPRTRSPTLTNFVSNGLQRIHSRNHENRARKSRGSPEMWDKFLLSWCIWLKLVTTSTMKTLRLWKSRLFQSRMPSERGFALGTAKKSTGASRWRCISRQLRQGYITRKNFRFKTGISQGYVRMKQPCEDQTSADKWRVHGQKLWPKQDTHETPPSHVQ